MMGTDADANTGGNDNKKGGAEGVEELEFVLRHERIIEKNRIGTAGGPADQ
jgi:hypothetical protein